MTFETLTEKIKRLKNDTKQPVLTDTQSALDLLATAFYEENCSRLVLMKEDITEAFFDLKTKIAGEVLQKFVNYGFRLAIVGDFSSYTSKSLRDFIYESNQGNTICFYNSIEEAVRFLEK